MQSLPPEDVSPGCPAIRIIGCHVQCPVGGLECFRQAPQQPQGFAAQRQSSDTVRAKTQVAIHKLQRLVGRSWKGNSMFGSAEQGSGEFVLTSLCLVELDERAMNSEIGRCQFAGTLEPLL